jgi:hypothetical protein
MDQPSRFGCEVVLDPTVPVAQPAGQGIGFGWHHSSEHPADLAA